MDTIRAWAQSISGGDGMHGLFDPVLFSPVWWAYTAAIVLFAGRLAWRTWKGK